MTGLNTAASAQIREPGGEPDAFVIEQRLGNGQQREADVADGIVGRKRLQVLRVASLFKGG